MRTFTMLVALGVLAMTSTTAIANCDTSLENLEFQIEYIPERSADAETARAALTKCGVVNVNTTDVTKNPKIRAPRKSHISLDAPESTVRAVQLVINSALTTARPMPVQRRNHGNLVIVKLSRI